MRPARLALTALLFAGAVAGQETVRSVVVSAQLSDDVGDARVRIEYVVAGAQAGRTISATILSFGVAPAVDLTVGAAGVAASFRPGPGRAQVVDLPVEMDPSGEGRVIVEYTVPSPVSAHGEALRGHLPILSLDRVPEEARPSLFSAEMTLPAGWTVAEAFPTGMHRVHDQAGATATYAVQLQVVPATLSFRAFTSGGWHPGLPLILDVLAGLVILAFSFAGWRHLREDTA